MCLVFVIKAFVVYMAASASISNVSRAIYYIYVLPERTFLAQLPDRKYKW